jgi:uncharacterized repeat protein (TIGR03803 family)
VHNQRTADISGEFTMKRFQPSRKLVMVPIITITIAMAITLTVTTAAQVGQFKVLHEFKGSFDGLAPVAGLIEDANGNLYGTTIGGGLNNDNTCNAGCGTVFELSPNGSGGWTKETLHRFTGNSDGGEPVYSLVMDGDGNLYGTNENGGSLLCGIPGCGTVFELSPNGSGGWTESTIYSFAPGSGGFSPSGLVRDGSGNLYGVTGSGGSNYGVVYELSLSGGVWTETVVHTFDKSDGFGPNSTLLLDGNGNLFGTTIFGGVLTGACKAVAGCGTEFELSPASGRGWNFNEYAFSSPGKGLEPDGTGLEDAAGNLVGVSSAGGVSRFGNVFQLTPVAGGGWTESVIHVFDGTKGSGPVGLVADGHGGYYGATAEGGETRCNSGCGLVFDLTPQAGGGWVETILHRFSGLYDGNLPNSLIVDANGNIFGTAQGGGSTACPGGCGTAFEITASAAK